MNHTVMKLKDKNLQRQPKPGKQIDKSVLNMVFVESNPSKYEGGTSSKKGRSGAGSGSRLVPKDAKKRNKTNT